MQHWELADRPDRLECRRLARIAEIDDVRFERRVVLVERDQDLVAERRQRVEIELQRHHSLLFLRERMRGAGGADAPPPRGGVYLALARCAASLSSVPPQPWRMLS